MKINRQYLGIFFGLSFVALLSQVIFLRQILLLFEQSEYVISIFLFLWLGTNGLGVLSGRRRPKKPDVLFIAQWYFVLIVLCYHGLVMLRPVLLSIKTLSMLWSGLLLAVLCIALPSFLNGYLFAAFSRHQHKGFNVLKIYKTESMAFVAAGVLSTLVVYVFTDFYLLAFALIGLSVLAVFIHFQWKKVVPAVIIALLLSATGLIQQRAFGLLFPDYTFAFSEQTPSGQLDYLVHREYNDTLQLFQGAPAVSVHPPAAHEEAAFPALANQTGKPRVLVAGSGIVPVLDGLSMAEFSSIDVVVSDIRLFQKTQQSWPAPVVKFLNRGEVNVVHSSIQQHLQNTKQCYDIIYLAEKHPALMENALLYFPDNLQCFHQHLSPKGVLCLLFDAEAASASRVSKALKGSSYQTLKAEFAHANILALDNYTLLLGADEPLALSFDEMEKNLHARHIFPQYFTAFHVQNRLLNAQQIGIEAMKQYPEKISFNKPVMYLAGLLKLVENYAVNPATELMRKAEEIYKHHRAWQLALLILFVLLFLWFAKVNLHSASVFQGGFIGIAAQMMFIYLYQLHFGNIYLIIGLLFALFMVGLTLALYTPVKKVPKWFAFSVLALVLISIMLMFAVRWMPVPFLGVLLSGYYTGIVFAQSNALLSEKSKDSSLLLYINDLMGSVAGNILIPLIIIPIAGFYLPVALMGLMGAVIFVFVVRENG